ncbi:MAG: autotransporter family protein [Planctomycetota bacterium]
MPRNRLTVAALAAWAAGLAAGGAAADFLWDGLGGDDLWATDGNWDPDGAPPLDLAGQAIEFGATGGAQSPDVAGDDYFDIAALTFTTADSSLVLTDSVGTGSLSFSDGGSITNDSALLQTIDIDLIGTGSDFLIDAQTGDLDIGGAIALSDTGGVLLTVAGDFDTTVSGIISGSGGSVLKTGDGTLTLNGDNTYDGGTELAGGTIVLGDNDALGTGALTLTGNGALRSDSDLRAIGNGIDTNGFVLSIKGANDLTLNSIIEGEGRLWKAGGGTLTLSRANNYDGGTVLAGGTIVLGNNRPLGFGALSVRGDSALESNDDDRSIFTDIDVDAGVTLTFSGGNDLGLRGVINGDGTLRVDADASDDRLTLSGDNTYTGGTDLNRGTIVLDHDNALGTGRLRLTGNGRLLSTDDQREISNWINTNGNRLTILGAIDLTLSGIIRGTGELTKTGTGALTLTRDNTYTGDTNINNGDLILDEASIAGLVNVNDRGTLRGTGTVGGDLTVFDGGTVSPGASVGTLDVGGNFDLQTGATFVVEIDADEATADLLDVAGTATLANGSTIEASLTGEEYIASGQTFTIIDAVGGVTDNGAVLSTDSATVTVSLILDNGFVNGDPEYALELFRANDAYSAAARGTVNKTIGRSLDSTIPIADAGPAGPAADLLARLDSLDGSEEYNTAVTQLSPQPYSSVTAADLGNTQSFVTQQAAYLAGKRAGFETYGFGPTPRAAGPLPGSLVLAHDDPLILATAFAQAQESAPAQPAEAAPRDYRWGRYAKIQGIFIDQDTTSSRTGFDSDSFGAQFGFDYDFSGNLVAGLAFGYMYTSTDYKEGLGDMDEHSVRAGPYLSYTAGDWYLDASATFAWHFYDGQRNIPSLDLTADSDYDGWDITGYLGTGYRFELDRNLYLTPMGSVLYSHFEFEDFTESGAGGANLSIDDRDADSLRSRLGANLSYRITDWAWEPIPYIYAGWEHEFLADDEDDIAASFATGGSPFTIDTGSRDEDAVFLGLGVNVLIKRNVSAFFRFEQVIGDNSDVSAAAGGLSVAF